MRCSANQTTNLSALVSSGTPGKSLKSDYGTVKEPKQPWTNSIVAIWESHGEILQSCFVLFVWTFAVIFMFDFFNQKNTSESVSTLLLQII